MIRDLGEMRARIIEAFRSLIIQCEPETGPLVSIIIPTRNEAGRLSTLLKSLRNQCYKNIEVIVADYKSTDGTPEIARALGARVLSLSKRGVGYATYIAVEKSRGEIIIRTDADAVFPRNAIKMALEMLLQDHVLVAHLGHVYYDGGPIENLMAFYYDKYLRKPWNTTGHFIAFKRELVEEGVNFNPRLPYDEDYDFGYRTFKIFGPRVFAYDHYKSVLVSARRIQATGLLKYVLGYRRR